MKLSVASVMGTRLQALILHKSTCNIYGSVVCFSTSPTCSSKKRYRLVVVGGGAAGQAMSHKFNKKLGAGKVAVIDPSDVHYYQPLWTLVGAGFRTFEDSRRTMKSLIPAGVEWIRDSVTKFDPENNLVITQNGDEIGYDYLIVAMGITLRYEMIKGLPEAFATDPRVCSNYDPQYVKKTLPAMENFTEGVGLYTFPATPIKCAGAPQKIMFCTEDYLRRNGRRDKTSLVYHTSLPAIFGIPRYAETLFNLAGKRGIDVVLRSNLIEVKADTHEAVFEDLDTKEITTHKYSMLHVGPPCSAPPVIAESPLSDETGFVEVNRETLQHKRYPNVFAIGDCASLPTAKTAAAVASQSGYLEKTINEVMSGAKLTSNYNGYTSCPLVTGKNKMILAEFGYDGSILETFPVDQRKERMLMFLLKTCVMPAMYWVGLVKGIWNGPGKFRNAFKRFRIAD